jgi:hypothetical protein
MKRFFIYIFAIFSFETIYSQVLWQANTGINYIYEPFKDYTLPGYNVGLGIINKKGFIFHLQGGNWYSNVSDNNFIHRYINLEKGNIPFLYCQYGYSTNLFKKISWNILSGFGISKLDVIRFFNISTTLKINFNRTIFLYNTLYLRGHNYVVLNFETGFYYLLSKEEKVKTFSFDDNIKKKIVWHFGYGADGSFAQFYGLPINRGNSATYKEYTFYTMNLSADMLIKHFLVKYMARIYVGSGNDELYIGGDTRVFHSVVFGFSNIEDKHTLYFSIANGWFFSDDITYNVSLEREKVSTREEFNPRFLLSPYIEMGVQRNNVSMGVYAQRIGSFNHEGYNSGGHFYTYTSPSIVYTWVGIKMNYRINY